MAVAVEKTGKTFSYKVNGKLIHFDDREVEGRDILNEAGFTPASEHQLILIKNGRTRLIGTDDTFDLKREEGGELSATHSDRTFAFTVNEIGQIWAAPEMSVDDFLTYWPAKSGTEWLLEREDQQDIVLMPGGVLDFDPAGAEDIVSRKIEAHNRILVTIFTTSGTFPSQGALKIDADNKISTLLERAAKKLRLASTDGWVLQHNGVDVDVSTTFALAGLTGSVDLEWGPREGGGGYA